MHPIKRGAGVNEAERQLALLADRIFLDLWSYPNLFFKRDEAKKGDGKELCDLLVVCGDDVLIFSVKDISWPKADDLQLAWSRWYRSAIDESASQIAGAERSLNNHPNQIFLDAACTQKLPLSLPPEQRRRTHRIALALGAAAACTEYFDDPFFLIKPSLRGSAHTNSDEGGSPFAIGDVRPDEPYVHVFNEAALELLGRELDTIIDFTNYLTCRERVMRSGKLSPVDGENDLLSYYLLSGGGNESHDFIRPDIGNEGDVVRVDPGLYVRLSREPNYLAKTKADKISYAWDRLIGLFTRDVLAGQTVAVFGEIPEAADAEEGIRSIALEPRVRRRLLADSFIKAMTKAEAMKADRYARVMLPGEHSADVRVTYIVVILAYHDKDIGDGYAAYRKHRTNMVQAYCLHVLHEHRDLRRAVGIGIDASSKVTGRKGSSQDLVALEVGEWTAEIETRAAELRAAYELMRPENVIHSRTSADEFPLQGKIRQLGPNHFRRLERALRTIVRRAAWRHRRRLRAKRE